MKYKGKLSIKNRMGENAKAISAEAFFTCTDLELIEVDKNDQGNARGNGHKAILDKRGSLFVSCHKTVMPASVCVLRSFVFYQKTENFFESNR